MDYMIITWDDLIEPPTPEKPVTMPDVHCLCGRFAKWAGGHNYYNGNYDCYSYTVHCTRCGDVTIECV